jgi:hypothetical protein
MAKTPNNTGDVDIDSLAETENYVAWLSNEPDGETVYHIELGAITLHFFEEEWRELNQLLDEARKALRS